jgi:hypothetical protein
MSTSRRRYADIVMSETTQLHGLLESDGLLESAAAWRAAVGSSGDDADRSSPTCLIVDDDSSIRHLVTD